MLAKETRCSIPLPWWRALKILLLAGLSATFAQAENWEVGGELYENVEIRDVTPDSVVIRHRRGIGSLRLDQLPAELQSRLAEQAEAAARHKQQVAPRQQAAHEALQQQRDAARRQKQATVQAVAAVNPLDQALQTLGQPVSLRPEVDLRPLFFAFGLHARNQSFRPSCSVFSIIGAMEYALASSGHPRHLSEEYLIWATLRYLEHHPEPLNRPEGESDEPGDVGFTLSSVMKAAQLFGVAFQSEMPNTRGASMLEVRTPPTELVECARNRPTLRSARLTGASSDEQIDHIIQMLNNNWPVVIGMAWPSAYTLRDRPLVHGQDPLPGYGHAVTLVGYFAPDGNKEQMVFFFRNSWGVKWGINGHGMVSRHYLLQHLQSAFVIDLDLELDPETGP